jgi:hypothetical protein
LADNLEITAGTGTSIATDEVDSKHFQKMKIADGTADSDVMVAASADYGLEVDVTRMPVDGTTGANASVTLVVEETAGPSYVPVQGAVINGANAMYVYPPSGAFSVEGMYTSGGSGAAVMPVYVGGYADSTLPAAVDDGDLVGLTTDVYGRLRVLPGANSGVDIGDVDILSIAAGTNLLGKVSIDQVTANANEVVIKSGTVTAVTGITNALPAGTALLGKIGIDQVTANANEVVIKSITAGNTNIGDVDVATLPALVASSAIIGNVRVDQTTPGTTNGVVVNSGTVTTVSTVTSVTAVAGMPTGASATAVQGTVASGGGAAQNPVSIGVRGLSTLPAVVDTGDVVFATADLLGRQVVVPHSPSADRISGCSAAITDTTATNVVATDSGAGLKWYITDIIVTNSHATVGTLVDIEDSAASVLWQGYAAPAGGGFTCHLVTPVATGANTHIHAKNTTTGSNTYICVSAYKAP